jgi:hypothetical protein
VELLGAVDWEVCGDGDESEETEAEGWERGSSSSSCGVWRRLRSRVAGALWDGRRRIVDSILPAFATDSRAMCQNLKLASMAKLRAF